MSKLELVHKNKTISLILESLEARNMIEAINYFNKNNMWKTSKVAQNDRKIAIEHNDFNNGLKQFEINYYLLVEFAKVNNLRSGLLLFGDKNLGKVYYDISCMSKDTRAIFFKKRKCNFPKHIIEEYRQRIKDKFNYYPYTNIKREEKHKDLN